MTDSPIHRLDALADDTERLRRLAATLAATDADDIVQDAYLAALESPRPMRASLGAWLSGVIRRLAANRRRESGRRARRERRAATIEALPSAADLTAELELHQRLAEAILGLAPVDRDAVILRYFEGLPPREAAARLEITTEIFRRRVNRALADLRIRLDRSYGGDRGAWLSVVPLSLHALSDGAGTTVSTGALLMTLKTKVVAIVALVIVACLGFLALRTDDADRDRGLAQGGERLAKSEARRDPGAVDAVPTSAPAAETASKGETTLIKVAYDDGTPAAFADVRISKRADPFAETDLREAQRRWRDLLVSRLDRWDLANAASSRFDADAGGLVRVPKLSQGAQVSARADTAIGWSRGPETDGTVAVTITRLTALKALVVDMNDAPVAGINVAHVSRYSRDAFRTEGWAWSNREGRATILTSLNDRSAEFLALRLASDPPVMVRLDAAMRRDEPIRLVMPETGEVAIDVRVANDRPAPDESVVLLTTVAGEERSNGSLPFPFQAEETKDGRATFKRVPLGSRLVAMLRPSRAWLGPTVEFDGPTASNRSVEVFMRSTWRERFLQARLVDRNGTPRPQSEVMITSASNPDFGHARRTDAAGHIRLATGLSDEQIEVATIAITAYGDFRPNGAATLLLKNGIESNDTIDLGDFTLPEPPAPLVQGIVVDSEGRPVAGARVDFEFSRSDSPTSWNSMHNSTPTALDGSFRVVAESVGDALRVVATMGDTLRSRPVAFERGAQGVKLVLEAAGCLEFEPLFAEGVDHAAMRILLWPRRAGPIGSPDVGSQWCTSWIRRDGRCRFVNLEPGDYDIVACGGGLHSKPPYPTVEGIRVAAGTVTVDPRLSPWDLRTAFQALALEFLSADGGHPQPRVSFVDESGDVGIGPRMKRRIVISSSQKLVAMVIQSEGYRPVVVRYPCADPKITLERTIAARLRSEPFAKSLLDRCTPWIELTPIDIVPDSLPAKARRSIDAMLLSERCPTGPDGALSVTLDRDTRYRIQWYVDPRSSLDQKDLTLASSPVGEPIILSPASGTDTLAAPPREQFEAALR